MKFLAIVGFLVVCLNVGIQAQEISCVTVLDNGDVSVTWGVSTAIDFNNYTIRDQNGGTVFQTNNQATTTAEISGINFTAATTLTLMVNTGAGAQTGNAYSPLILQSITGQSEAVDVQWLAGEFSGPFDVYRMDENDVDWVFAGTANGTTFQDGKKVCNEELIYQVRVDEDGCQSTSSTLSATISDEQGPDAPEVLVASIDPASDELTIEWEPSTADDVRGYVIYSSDAVGSQQKTLIDSIHGPLVTSYTGMVVPDWVQPQTFSIAAFDSCRFDRPVIGMSYGAGPTGDEHTVAVLNPLNYSPSERSVVLSWEAYEGWPVGAYEIWYEKEGEVAPVKDGEVGPGVGTYVVNDLEINTNYVFYIKAVENGGSQTSTSNGVLGVINVGGIPDSLELHAVNVLLGDVVSIYSTTDVDEGTTYQLMRSPSQFGNFQVIQSTDEVVDRVVQFGNDQPPGLSSATYYYRVCALDSWGGVTSCTDALPTLQGPNVNATENDIQVELDWQIPALLDTGNVIVDQISILRYDPATGALDEVLVADPSEMDWADDLEGTESSQGTICYQLAYQVSNASESYTITTASRCVTLQPRVWLPNAFAPNGVAGITSFRPVSIYLSEEQYYFAIFDRWGEVVFETSQVDDGWDGDAKSDVYSWILKYNPPSKSQVVLMGKVVLIR